MNKKILTGALAALTLGGALAATTTLPAAAQGRHESRGGDYRGGGEYRGGGGYRGGGEYRGGDYRGRGGDRGWGGGTAALLGLSVGAALAGGGGYYAPSYYPETYYAAPRCRVEMRWNGYWGGYDRVRVCY